LIAAARRGAIGDWVLTGMTQVGLAVPNFWLGIAAGAAVRSALHWVSAGGFPGWQRGRRARARVP
jgi:ABC-type dipeptide/oligopeptide/nickel transport system permease component